MEDGVEDWTGELAGNRWRVRDRNFDAPEAISNAEICAGFAGLEEMDLVEIGVER